MNMYTENQNRNLVGQESLMRLPDVLELIPVSRSSWYAGIKSGKYPKSVKLGVRMTAWKRSEIDTLIRSFMGK